MAIAGIILQFPSGQSSLIYINLIAAAKLKVLSLAVCRIQSNMFACAQCVSSRAFQIHIRALHFSIECYISVSHSIPIKPKVLNAHKEGITSKKQNFRPSLQLSANWTRWRRWIIRWRGRVWRHTNTECILVLRQNGICTMNVCTTCYPDYCHLN